MPLIDLANPSRFLALADRVLPWLAAATVLAFAFGINQVFLAPDDYQQGATVKIMFIHVPAAWLGMFAWGLMSIAALGTLVWRHPLADVAAKAAAPIGAAFTLMCLVTGSLWGRPMWGTYWVWDARLTSVLVLFLMYLGVIALWRTIDDPVARRARRRGAHAGRRDQPADHQVLGRLVEHAAPAGLGDPARRPDHRSVHPDAAAHHGDRLHAVVPHAASRRHAQRDHAPARAHDDDAPGRRGRRALTMNLGPHAAFIVIAYAAAVAIVGVLIVWVVLDRRHLRRTLADLEAQGVTRRSDRAATPSAPAR